LKKTFIPMISVLILLFFLASCTADPRDDCCIAIDGRRDAPFSTTYLFQYKTGTRNIVAPGNELGLLRIISEADILTLKNAASTSQLKKNGLITGAVQGRDGPAREVNLQVTDRDGNIVSFNSGVDRNFFFNSLGLVPDFLVTRGTGNEGTFTLFNVPTGELFFEITSGGRGNGRITSIESAVSIGQIETLPVFPDRIEVLGVISGASSGNPVPDGTASFFGNEKPVAGNADGLFILPVEEAIPTQGDFLIRLKAPSVSSREVSVRFDTAISKVTGRLQAFDPLTANGLFIFSNERLNAITEKAGITLTTSMAIVTGRTRGADGTGKGRVSIIPLDQEGKSLAEKDGSQRLFYFEGGADESGGLDPSLSQTTDNAQYILFVDSCEDLSPIELHSFGTTVTNPVGVTTGRSTALCRPGGIFVQDILQVGLPGDPPSDPPMVTVAMNGSIFTQDSVKVNNAQVQALGASDASLVAVNGDYRFDQGQPGAVSPLLANSRYTFRTALDENYIPTYQSVLTGAGESVRRLTLLTDEMRERCLPSRDINFLGRVLDLGLLDPSRGGRPIGGLSLTVVQENGTEVGRIVYPNETSETSANGQFIVCDLPGPGVYQVRVSSKEDSGAVLIRNYGDGVSLFDMTVNKALPRNVLVLGKVVKLLEGMESDSTTPIGDALIKVHGILDETLVDSAGDFSLVLGSNGRYILQVEKEGQLSTYNYHVDTPAQVEQTSITPLRSVSRQEVDRIASQMSLTQTAGQGLLSGKTVIRGLSGIGISLGSFEGDAIANFSGFFDGDRHVDTIVISNTGTLAHFFGDGLGAMQKKEPGCPPLGLSPQEILQSDFNLDGRADLVIISGGSVFIFLGNEEGCFDTPEEITETILEGKAKTFSLADFNGDNLLDILVATDNSAPLIRLASRGDGTFEAFKMEGNCGTNPLSVLARMGGGGLIDVIVADSVTGVCEITYDDALAAQPTKIMELPEDFLASGLKMLRSVFLDADGTPDVLVIHERGGAAFLGLPPTDITVGSIPFNVTFNFPQNFDVTSITLLDFNRDNRNDLLVGGSLGLLFMLGNGDGTFGLSATISSSASPVFSLLDLNEDGEIDLLAPQAGVLTLFLGGDAPQADIKIEVRDSEGVIVGDIAYLDNAGELLPEATKTDGSGRFLVLNVPTGRTLVQVIEGGSGNNILTTFADGLSYFHLNMNTVIPDKILLDGQVINPTSGATVGIAVDNIKITPLSTGLEALSLDIFDDPATEDIDEGRQGAFQIELGATSEYILKLDPQPF